MLLGGLFYRVLAVLKPLWVLTLFYNWIMYTHLPLCMTFVNDKLPRKMYTHLPLCMTFVNYKLPRKMYTHLPLCMTFVNDKLSRKMFNIKHFSQYFGF